MLDSEYRKVLIEKFKNDRFLAHETLFAHRHKEKSAACHGEIVELFNSDHPLVALMAFRGAAKSTYVEEDVILSALFEEEEFIIIVGNSWSNACERLASIKQELETNDALIELFGDQKSSPWAADEIVLANGIKIQAMGARQSMRGVKHNNARPTRAVIDDLEDEEDVATEESRRKTERWLTGTLRPALHPKRGKIRFIGTPLHPKALIQKKIEDPEWVSRKYPVLYIDDEGQERSTWPERFDIAWVLKLRAEYLASGNLIEFEQEYMCRAEDVAGKPFQASMIKVAAAPANYLPIDIAVDPARTTKKATSARTGYAAGSWLGQRLIVHDAKGSFDKPDEIINTIFEWNDRFKPVHIGVEVNSLDEFILQPLRAKMISSGITIPLVPLYAPNNKDEFIKGLQPFYMSGNVSHAKPLPDLESELLQFPTGRKDVPNALAYLMRMRAGRTVYEDFTHDHIASELEVAPGAAKWLVIGTRPALTVGALIQNINGVLRIYQDWVISKPPMEALPELLREAIMASEGGFKLAASQEELDKYSNNGLPAAARHAQTHAITRVGYASKSEGALKEWLTRRNHGEAALLVSSHARWVVNGIAGGYARRLEKGGMLADKPTDNQYRVLLEAIESFVGWVDNASKMTDDIIGSPRYDVATDGRRYLSSRPRGHR